jgi:membrane protein involved in colicin uptake
MTLRAIAQEAELAKTTMEKEVAETTARLALENEQQAEALERAAVEARANLETELSARRAEAEKALLEAHQKAVELNDRYTADLTEQHADLKERVAALRSEHQKLIEAIEESNATGKTRAMKESADLVAAAEEKAAELIHAAEKEATSRVAAAEARLIELTAEREAIASYVESLRTVVGDVLDHETPQPSTPRKTRAKDTSAG